MKTVLSAFVFAPAVLLVAALLAWRMETSPEAVFVAVGMAVAGLPLWVYVVRRWKKL